jgi:menaquinone-9 beta-reductase
MAMGVPVVNCCTPMNTQAPLYDTAIVGGGLAGLSLSILLARRGFQVIVFEKEKYPFHKVCGEYISMESWDFLTGLGVPLESWNLPLINQVLITAIDGSSIIEKLPTGGFGISRHKLDSALSVLAREAGVELFENSRVQEIIFENNYHRITTNEGSFIARVTCACFGKKSNLDVKWKRKFSTNKNTQNYVGVKYHVRLNLPATQIALHNFNGGYCGISRIENDRYCLCYLTRSENLKKNNQSIQQTEENVLKKNPFLKKILNECERLYEEPLTIAQISFRKKNQVENHILFVGDAAGMITPLCGNGMSMALHASKIAGDSIMSYLTGDYSREYMEIRYREQWKNKFASRLRTGRIIQRFFGNPFLSSLLIRCLKPFPALVRAIIKNTHGERF